MTAQTSSSTHRRLPLTRERVLRTAIERADRGGLEAMSMRKLGQELGVEAMALYHHFASKDVLIDAMLDLVFAEIDLPMIGAEWQSEMRRRAISLHDVLARHRWAVGLMESRANPGPANLRHHDAVIGCLRAAGFDMQTTAHAYSLLDAYIYGFALTKMSLPFDASSDVAAIAQDMLRPFPADEYPHLVEFIASHAMQPGYDYADEFEFGLDLILDDLERVRREASVPPPD